MIHSGKSSTLVKSWQRLHVDKAQSFFEEFLSTKSRTVPNWWSFWSCQSIFGLLKLFWRVVLCWEVLFCAEGGGTQKPQPQSIVGRTLRSSTSCLTLCMLWFWAKVTSKKGLEDVKYKCSEKLKHVPTDFLTLSWGCSLQKAGYYISLFLVLCVSVQVIENLKWG